MDIKEEIKSRIGIVELVSEYVELKKSGRSYKGLCPFHNEKSPSFIVSPDKGIAYCFGCNQGGDIFAFLEGVEGIDFPEALKRLADKANVTLPTFNVSQNQEKKSLMENELGLMAMASHKYQEYLWSDYEDSRAAYDYLVSRGLADKLIKEFGLGIAPKSKHYLLKIFSEQGISEKLLLSSGLVLSDDTLGRKLIDRFVARLMIPIEDDKGRVVGFGGRALYPNQNPKYLNSSDSAIYSKSQILYNFHRAKEHIRKQNFVIVVEGYFDVMAFWQAGVKNVVATCGTALTDEHVRLIARFADTVVLAFDNDEAGLKAGIRGSELCFLHNLVVRFIDFSELGEFKDAGDVLLKNSSLLLSTAEKQGCDFFDFIWRREFASLTQAEREDISFQTAFLERYLPLIVAEKSLIRRDLLMRKFSQFLRTEPKVLYQEVARISKSLHNSFMKPVKNELVGNSARDFIVGLNHEELFWGYLWARPELIQEIWPDVQKLAFVFTLNDVYNLFSSQYNGERVNGGELPPEMVQKFDRLALYLESKDVQLKTINNLLQEVKLLLQRLASDYKKQQLTSIMRSIADAETEGDQAKLNELLVQYNTLMALN